jgi:hypothetical protein
MISDSAGANVVVLLTDTTSVKSNKKGLGIFRRGQDFEVTSLLRGLVITTVPDESEECREIRLVRALKIAAETALVPI